MIKDSTEIFEEIKSRFEERIGDTVAEGSALDIFASSISEQLKDNYDEIEKSRNPHIWTSLYGDNLDATGTWVNLPREERETDDNYRYRLMNWTLRNEACNLTAINDTLLNMTYASDAEYYPRTHGAGTGTVYVIPVDYSNNTIEMALREAQERMKKVSSPESYVEYIVPTKIPVDLSIYISSSGDIDAIKQELEPKIKTYINAIPPKEYLKIGEINAIGINTSGVDYFNVVVCKINNVYTNSVRILQEINTKMILNNITWMEAS